MRPCACAAPVATRMAATAAVMVVVAEVGGAAIVETAAATAAAVAAAENEPHGALRAAAGHDDVAHDRHPGVRDRVVPEAAGERPAGHRLSDVERERQSSGCEPG